MSCKPGHCTTIIQSIRSMFLCLVCLVIVLQSYSQQDVCPCVLYAWSLYNNHTVNKIYVLVSCMPDHCTTIIQSTRCMSLCLVCLIIVQQSYSQQDVCPCVLYAWSLYYNHTVNNMYVLVSCMPGHCTTIIQSIRSMSLCLVCLVIVLQSYSQ